MIDPGFRRHHLTVEIEKSWFIGIGDVIRPEMNESLKDMVTVFLKKNPVVEFVSFGMFVKANSNRLVFVQETTDKIVYSDGNDGLFLYVADPYHVNQWLEGSISFDEMVNSQRID